MIQVTIVHIDIGVMIIMSMSYRWVWHPYARCKCPDEKYSTDAKKSEDSHAPGYGGGDRKIPYKG